MNEQLTAAIDPQEHVDAISRAAEVMKSGAEKLMTWRTNEQGKFGYPEDAENHAKTLRLAQDLEAAAEAFIDLQTERDAISAAAVDLIVTIDNYTDCMTNEVAREPIDPWIEKLQLLLPGEEKHRPAPAPRKQTVQIGLLLSATFAPALNKATDLLRTRLMNASDGELLEQIFLAGIMATIESVERQQRAKGAA